MRADSEEHRRQDNGGTDRLLGVCSRRADRQGGGAMTQAKYIETFAGYDYFRDEHGNVYAKIGEEIMFCSNHKRGQLTEDKAEPSYPVHDVEISY